MSEVNYNDCIITSLDIDKDLEKFLSMNDLDKEIERIKKERSRLTTEESIKTKSTSSLSSNNNKKPQYIIKEKVVPKKPELIQPVMERIDAELNKLEQSGLVEKIGLHSIELIDKPNKLNKSSNEYNNNNRNFNEEIFQTKNQTSSIIPQTQYIQNNGQGLTVPNYNGNVISHQAVTAKLQDLIIPSPNIKYHMI
jgi:hypothetical protein